jgi:hypothetical protein
MRAPAPRWDRLGFRPFLPEPEPRAVEGPVRRPRSIDVARASNTAHTTDPVRTLDTADRRTHGGPQESWLSPCACPDHCLRDHDTD